MCECCSKLTIKTLERRLSRRPGVFIVSFEQISPLFQVFLLSTLNEEEVNACLGNALSCNLISASETKTMHQIIARSLTPSKRVSKTLFRPFLVNPTERATLK